MKSNLYLKAGAFFAFLSVLLGAFATHALKERLPIYSIEVFKTGVLYQFLHSFGLLLIGTWCEKSSSKALKRAGLCFIFGILIFSGSLYAIATLQIPAIGIITPLGGLLFLVGWLFLLKEFL
jgi:uncharacterized membrane protein YgdD (TMEM256/DUF423 family)